MNSSSSFAMLVFVSCFAVVGAGCEHRTDPSEIGQVELSLADDGVKIAPPSAKPPHPLVIIDPQQRLMDGAVAVLQRDPCCITLTLDLDIRGRTGLAQLPAETWGGFYDVTVEHPAADDVAAGILEVVADPPPAAEPYVEPTEAWPGEWFMVSDPQGRIPQGAIAVLYREGTDPATGAVAVECQVSIDGTSLTCQLPSNIGTGYLYISVRETLSSTSVFADLLFTVKA